MDLSSIQSLFTPSVLFVLLNVVIGTIAVLSSRQHHRSSHGGDGGGGDQQQQQRPIARSSSSNVLERVRSLGRFRFRSGDLQPVTDDHDDHIDNSTMDQNHQQQQQQFRRIQSESDSKKAKSKDEESDSAAAATASTNSKMKKSVSEKVEIVRRPPARVDEGVDAKADNFINKFRQQLKLQRLDSLLRYKEMLTGKRN